MKYIIKITYNGHSEYVADGKTYVVNGEPYIPLTSRQAEAKRYTSRGRAERASERNATNTYGNIEIVEVEE